MLANEAGSICQISIKFHHVCAMLTKPSVFLIGLHFPLCCLQYFMQIGLDEKHFFSAFKVLQRKSLLLKSVSELTWQSIMQRCLITIPQNTEVITNPIFTPRAIILITDL